MKDIKLWLGIVLVLTLAEHILFGVGCQQSPSETHILPSDSASPGTNVSSGAALQAAVLEHRMPDHTNERSTP